MVRFFFLSCSVNVELIASLLHSSLFWDHMDRGTETRWEQDNSSNEDTLCVILVLFKRELTYNKVMSNLGFFGFEGIEMQMCQDPDYARTKQLSKTPIQLTNIITSR